MKTAMQRFSRFWDSGLVKRLATAIPIAIALSAFASTLGAKAFLLRLFLGFLSYSVADWIFSTQSERKERTQQVTAFLSEYWLSIVKWGIYVLMCSYFFSSRSAPSEPAIQQLLSLVEIFGLLIVLAVPIITSQMNPALFASRVLQGILFYSMALWLIGYAGDDVYLWVVAHPNDAAIAAVACYIVWVIAYFSRHSLLGSESHSKSRFALSEPMAAGSVEKATARDKRYMAAHEAGHALVYAALDDLPSDMRVVLNDYSDVYGVLGFVRGFRTEHRLVGKSFAEWKMLVLLAGQFGESFVRGESTLGSGSDYQRWLALARPYLAHHHHGIYYPDSQNKLEQERNEAKLESLQTEQLALLREFFSMNVRVYEELVETLLENKTMNRDDLLPFLRRVKFPDGFPFPFGEAGSQ